MNFVVRVFVRDKRIAVVGMDHGDLHDLVGVL